MISKNIYRTISKNISENAMYKDGRSSDVKNFDIILITGEYYDDHPLSPAGIIARVLDAKGFSVGIIEKPLVKEDYIKLGKPKLCFCVTSGSVDSMVNNYTPLKKSRFEDQHSKVTEMPDRAVIIYCNKLRELFKGCKLVIGGVEASLRRFAHYDYWDNKVRRSILFDSRADILVYGNGEKQIIEIAERLRDNQELLGIEGTCVICKKKEELVVEGSTALDKGTTILKVKNINFELLPDFKDVQKDEIKDKKAFCRMTMMFSNEKNLAQEYDNNYLLQYKYPKYTPEDLDWIYGLNYTRKLHKQSLLKMGKFSVVTHRGCIGACSFCSICLHQGSRIISRSENSILEEIKNLANKSLHPDFKGYIDDFGGPSANMYGMDCVKCDKKIKGHANSNKSRDKFCYECPALDTSCKRLISLLKKARAINGVKKIFVRSGIRYDLALKSKEYIQEISKHHISGCLKIAPEHFSSKVLKLMNKDNSKFDEFVEYFRFINQFTYPKQELKYYFMVGHPGDNKQEVMYLMKKASKLKNTEAFQLFTPTPMTISSCMYWTGLDPFTLKKVDVVYDYKGKKELKRILLD
ncbi:MAG: YgiQ family radical SAM protein [Candidatus Woesearchaeota archaeon]